MCFRDKAGTINPYATARGEYEASLCNPFVRVFKRQSEHSWSQLRKFGFTAAELHSLQPNPEDWIVRGKVNLEDLRDMIIFPVYGLAHHAFTFQLNT